MKLAISYFGLLLVPALACSDTADINSFQYGGDQPGANYPEGGEIRHERVNLLGMPAQTWVHVYQMTGSPATAPFPAPAEGGKGKYGPCVDERDGSPTWPFTPLENVTYLELPKVELSGPGISGKLVIEKTDPPNQAGNSTFRAHDFTYGGGAPGDTNFFNAGKTTAEMSTPGGEYTLDIGKGEPMTYFMPEAYETPLGIGKVEKVTFPGNQPLSYEWTPPANDNGSTGIEHTKKTHFNFTLFADPADPNGNPPQFICFPSVDGKMEIPQAVIDELPAGGLIVHANLSHYMEARETCNGTEAPGCTEGVTEIRRFDLVSIFCNISLYEKQ